MGSGGGVISRTHVDLFFFRCVPWHKERGARVDSGGASTDVFPLPSFAPFHFHYFY